MTAESKPGEQAEPLTTAAAIVPDQPKPEPPKPPEPTPRRSKTLDMPTTLMALTERLDALEKRLPPVVAQTPVEPATSPAPAPKPAGWFRLLINFDDEAGK